MIAFEPYLPEEIIGPVDKWCRRFVIMAGLLLCSWWAFPWMIPVRFGRWLFVGLGLMGCAAVPLPPMIDEVNYMVNQIPACGVSGPARCHPQWPTRPDLEAASGLDCTGYVMRKAYTLAALQVHRDRMRVAVFEYGHTLHAVLVIDGEHTLDNLEPSVRQFSEYARFDPVLKPVPWSTR